MSGTDVPLSNLGNGYTIVTHVISPPTASTGTQQNVCRSGPLQKFLKGEPKALGTVQIMIGLLMFLFGIVISIHAQSPITVYSGISFWGGVLHIITGSLSISASNKLNRCVVNGSLAMNVVSTIIAATAIILLSIDLGIMPGGCYYSGYNNYYGCASRTESYGIIGVLLVFNILGFIISICISVFSCKAVCNNEPVVNITVVSNQEGCSVVNPLTAQAFPAQAFPAQAFPAQALPAQAFPAQAFPAQSFPAQSFPPQPFPPQPFPAQNTQQWMYGASGAAMNNPPMENPPEYTETKCHPDN